MRQVALMWVCLLIGCVRDNVSARLDGASGGALAGGAPDGQSPPDLAGGGPDLAGGGPDLATADLAPCPAPSAGSFYVAPTGSDTAGNGSQSCPFVTITKALAAGASATA